MDEFVEQLLPYIIFAAWAFFQWVLRQVRGQQSPSELPDEQPIEATEEWQDEDWQESDWQGEDEEEQPRAAVATPALVDWLQEVAGLARSQPRKEEAVSARQPPPIRKVEPAAPVKSTPTLLEPPPPVATTTSKDIVDAMVMHAVLSPRRAL